MKKVSLIVASLLTINTTCFASSWTDDIDWGDCTESNPCYYDGHSLHHIDTPSDNGWNSYTITGFTVGLTVALAYPLIQRAIDYGVDYCAYRFNCLRGLRDGGGVAQTREFKRIATATESVNTQVQEIHNIFGSIRGPITQSLLSANEKKEALKLIFDAVTGGNENFLKALHHLAQRQESSDLKAENTQKALLEALTLTRETFTQSMQENQASNKSLQETLMSLNETLEKLAPKEDE